MNLTALLVNVVIARRIFASLTRHLRRQLVDLVVNIDVVFGLAGDDERRTRFVNQNRINFVDDGVIEAALAAIRHRVFHVVAQVIETEFVVSAVGDIGGVRGDF